MNTSQERAKLVSLEIRYTEIQGAPVDKAEIERYVDGIVAWDLARHINNVRLAIAAHDKLVKYESSILHETPTHWVSVEKFKGREVCKVWRTGITHSTLRATLDVGAASRDRAITLCNDFHAMVGGL